MSPQVMAALAHAKRLAVNMPAVRGVDYGFRYEEGKGTRKLAIRFHVAAKLPPAEVPGSQLLPKKIRGISCDVIQASYQPHAAAPTALSAAISPGLSIGNLVRQSAGSLGCFVQFGGKTCLLSNWHVLAASPQFQRGEAIVHPAPSLAGGANEIIAQLERATDLAHGCDAAIATVKNGITFDSGIGQNITIGGMEKPSPGMRVMKRGAVTGVTRAVVDGTHGSFRIDYTSFGDQARFMDGIRLVPDPQAPQEEISLNGDSGAVWVNASSGAAVALHFAGEDHVGPLAEFAVAHSMSQVVQLLQLTAV